MSSACTVNSTYVAISVWHSTLPSKNLFPTSSLTQEREKSSTDELHNKIRRRVFFVLRVTQVKKAKDLFSDKLHTRAHTWKPLSPPGLVYPFLPFCHSAILSAIPPLTPFPPFDHSICHSIPPFRLLFRHSCHYFCCGLRGSYINSVTPQPACLHLQFLSVYNSHNDK